MRYLRDESNFVIFYSKEHIFVNAAEDACAYGDRMMWVTLCGLPSATPCESEIAMDFPSRLLP